jgi:hypothetical protein
LEEVFYLYNGKSPSLPNSGRVFGGGLLSL